MFSLQDDESNMTKHVDEGAHKDQHTSKIYRLDIKDYSKYHLAVHPITSRVEIVQ